MSFVMIVGSFFWATCTAAVFARFTKLPRGPMTTKSFLVYWVFAFVAAIVPVLVRLRITDIWDDEHVQLILSLQAIVSLLSFAFARLFLLTAREVRRDPPPTK